MEKEINWKAAAMDIFEENVRLKQEIKYLQASLDFWMDKELVKKDKEEKANREF